MFKRIAAISTLILALSAAPALSWGVGLAFGVDGGVFDGLPGSDAMLSVKPPDLPVTIGAGLEIGADRFQMGTTLDWILVRENLFSFVNVYAGPGLYLALPEQVEFGGRVPVGLNAFPTDWFELFFEVAPNLAVVADDSIDIPNFGFQSAFGFRFWF